MPKKAMLCRTGNSISQTEPVRFHGKPVKNQERIHSAIHRQPENMHILRISVEAKKENRPHKEKNIPKKMPNPIGTNGIAQA